MKWNVVRQFFAQMIKMFGGDIPHVPSRRKSDRTGSNVFEFRDVAVGDVYQVASEVISSPERPNEITYRLTITLPKGDTIEITQPEQIPGAIERVREERERVRVQQDAKSPVPAIPKGGRVLA